MPTNRVPIGIITSKMDEVVAPEHARDLYTFIGQHCPPGVLHWCLLEHSCHDGYAYDDKGDVAAYTAFIQTLKRATT